MAGGRRRPAGEKAQQCQTCHGIDGVGKMPDVPNIGGESDDLSHPPARGTSAPASASTSRCRSSPRGLSDEDIADLAAWYSSIEFTVTLPQ